MQADGKYKHPDKISQEATTEELESQKELFQFLEACIGMSTEYGMLNPDPSEPAEMGWHTEEEAMLAEQHRRKKRAHFDRVMRDRMGNVSDAKLDSMWETCTTAGPRIGQGIPVHFSGTGAGADEGGRRRKRTRRQRKKTRRTRRARSRKSGRKPYRSLGSRKHTRRGGRRHTRDLRR